MNAAKNKNKKPKEMPMRACATPGGGVMFIPDRLAVKSCNKKEKVTRVSYTDLVAQETDTKQEMSALERFELFAKKIAALKAKKAA